MSRKKKKKKRGQYSFWEAFSIGMVIGCFMVGPPTLLMFAIQSTALGDWIVAQCTWVVFLLVVTKILDSDNAWRDKQ